MTLEQVLSNTHSGLPGKLRRLRRVKHISADALENRSKEDDVRPEGPLTLITSATIPGNLLRLWLRSPWEDYASVWTVPGEPTLVYRRGGYFQKSSLREFSNAGGGLKLLQALSSFRHPNIAKIYDVYCHADKIYTISEYLELSLNDIDFHSFILAEWEIATIIVEVTTNPDSSRNTTLTYSFRY